MNILEILLKNRGLKTAKEQKEFLNPKPPQIKLNLKKTIDRIKKAVKNNEPIIVYGDYDADGICATAIMWEALHDLGANVLPYIPEREKESYGLTIPGIKNLDPQTKLIITVDNGITADKAVAYAKKKGMDVIILDHHEKPKKLPKAYAIVYTPKLCASGIAYFVAEALGKDCLELAAIATITDLMPLLKENRSIVKYGLEVLNKTTRPGLRALLDVAGITKVGTYEVGYMIGPRLNASGRIDSALVALRLLCTKNYDKAKELAERLNTINKERQTLLEEQTIHAISQKSDGKIILIEHESYHQGIIGLVAGKLVEKYYRPAIVIARGEKLSKGSARSVAGFNIIEAIRTTQELLIDAGGHPMAAGFTIETGRISDFRFRISDYAQKKITDEMLARRQRVDLEINLDQVNLDLYDQIQRIAPFGMGNPEPVFKSMGTVQNIRTVGAEGKHLKLVVDGFDAIGFSQGALASKLKAGQKISLAYSLDLNSFNGKTSLQLKVKDLGLDS